MNIESNPLFDGVKDKMNQMIADAAKAVETAREEALQKALSEAGNLSLLESAGTRFPRIVMVRSNGWDKVYTDTNGTNDGQFLIAFRMEQLVPNEIEGKYSIGMRMVIANTEAECAPSKKMPTKKNYAPHTGQLLHRDEEEPDGIHNGSPM
jgi:hypothetical protein